MTHAIDENAGLPDLPESHRWVISPKRISSESGYFWFDDPKILNISIERFSVQQVSVSKKMKGLFGRKKKIKSLESREVTEKLISIELQGNNPIAARNAANRAMKEFEALKMRDSLIGTYPPKKLEG